MYKINHTFHTLSLKNRLPTSPTQIFFCNAYTSVTSVGNALCHPAFEIECSLICFFASYVEALIKFNRCLVFLSHIKPR